MKNITLVILSGLTCSAWASGKCQDSYKLKETNDVSKVVNCEEISGNLEVTGYFMGQLKLEKLKKVHGSIKIDAKDISNISFDNLETVINNIELKDIVSVPGIYMPKLNSINKLYINNVGGDYELNFESGLKSINNLEIFDTRIKKLQGIRAERIDTIKLNGVPELTQLDLPETKDVVNSLEVIGAQKAKINANKLAVIGKDLKLIAFSSFSLNSLTSVGGEATFTGIGSSELTIPNLTKVGGPGLTISDTQQLQTVKFPNLTRIDGFLNIDKTSNLVSVDISHLDTIKDGFSVDSPKLTELKTGATLHGNGGFKINSGIECNKLENKNGFFSSFQCKYSKKEQGKDQNNQPKDNTSSASLTKMSLSASLIMGTLFILYL